MEPLKYPCLILDHDNTVVRTSPDIQYPAFLHSLKCAGLDFSLSEREFLLIEYEGLQSFIREHFHLTPKMFQKIDDGWFDYMSRHTAKIYDGMAEILQRHRAAGFIIPEDIPPRAMSSGIIKPPIWHRLTSSLMPVRSLTITSPGPAAAACRLSRRR